MKATIEFHFDRTNMDEIFVELEKAKEKHSVFVRLFFERVKSLSQIFTIQNLERTTGGTNHYFVRLEPTNFLLEFMMALRARELD